MPPSIAAGFQRVLAIGEDVVDRALSMSAQGAVSSGFEAELLQVGGLEPVDRGIRKSRKGSHLDATWSTRPAERGSVHVERVSRQRWTSSLRTRVGAFHGRCGRP